MFFKDRIKSNNTLMNKFKKWEKDAINDIEFNAASLSEEENEMFWEKYSTGRYINSPVVQKAILTSKYATDKALIAIIDVNPSVENIKLLFQRENLTRKPATYALNVMKKPILTKWVGNNEINNLISDIVTEDCFERAKKDPFCKIEPHETWCIRYNPLTFRFIDYLETNGANEKINTAIFNNNFSPDKIKDNAFDKGIIFEDVKSPLTKSAEDNILENSFYVLYKMPTNSETEKAQVHTARVLAYLVDNKYLSNSAQLLLYNTVNKNIYSPSQFNGNSIIKSLATSGTDPTMLTKMINNLLATDIVNTIIYENNNCPIEHKKEREEHVCELLRYYKTDKKYQESEILNNFMWRENFLIEFAIKRCDDFPKLLTTLVDLDFRTPQLEMMKNKKMPAKYLRKMEDSNHIDVEISAMFLNKYINKYSDQKGLDEFIDCIALYMSNSIEFTKLKEELNKVFESLSKNEFSRKNISKFSETLSEVMGDYIKKHPEEKNHLYDLQDIVKVIRNKERYMELSLRLPETLSNNEIEFVKNELIKEFYKKSMIDIYKEFNMYEDKYNRLEKALQRGERECQDHHDQPVTEMQTR